MASFIVIYDKLAGDQRTRPDSGAADSAQAIGLGKSVLNRGPVLWYNRYISNSNE